MNKIHFGTAPAWLDDSAFEAIFHEYYPGLHALLARLTGDSLEADDLAAETFWRLWQRPPAQQERIGGWLYRVATRLGYNALRANRRRAQYEMRSLEIDPEQQPDREVEQRMEQKAVRQVFRQMPLRDVQVLLLRHSGLRYKEIAAIVDLPPANIGVVLARAEARFEAIYQKGADHASR